jgi:adenine phosphoribosyltransferase
VSADDLRAKIREIPDFPKPGILFYDITTLLKEPPTPTSESIDLMLEPYRDKSVDLVVGMESRGFIFSGPIAIQLNAGFVPVRKLGKLPAETVSVEYALEYGSNTLEIHKDALQPGQRVLIVDDLLATGGTVLGTIELVKRLKAEIVGSGLPRRAALPQGPRTAGRLLHDTASSSTDPARSSERFRHRLQDPPREP